MIINRHKIDSTKILKDIKESTKLKRSILFVVGVLLSSISFNLFIKPSHLIYGVSGISVMTEKYYNLDPSFVIMLGNMLLLIASYIFLGKEDTRHTVIGSLLYPIFVKLTDSLPNYIDLGNTEPIVIAICGAIISGIGTGLVFKNNFTTGGTDVLKQIFTKYGKMPYSSANLCSEGVIMLLGGAAFGWQAFIYSCITLVVSGYISDRVIMGISEYKTLEIITEKDEEIKKFIMENLNHGITEIDAKGAYTDKKKKMLLCALPTRKYFIASEGIKKIDPNAFVIVIDTYEIQGNK